LPTWSIKIVEKESGRDIDVRSDFVAKAYASEIEKAEALRHEASSLQTQIKAKWKEAKEEQELIDLFVTNQKLRFKDLQKSVSEGFQACKKQFEQKAISELRPLRHTYEAYLSGTKEGIEQHFSLGLETIQLPLPPHFPWRVFYDPEERLIQINQRVPFTPEIVVKRTENKRPLAKRDIYHFLRRLVPAISLHIAANVAENDARNHIDAIAVNCWPRYFEKTTGRLKDAFVSSVKMKKKTILEMNIDRADPLDAFRALRGAFVYSTEEIVPIEPQIRLDKNDARFVAGKEILEGMAQGQNLATMDWQDFEHLIRELLAKEYGKNGSDVRITRASRDRGVDAVVFDPDPLHGGKSVVQAKRYNNLVDVSAVRDLYGTMMNEGAARVILVTTSRYGRDAFDFASNKPITLIDGQNLLSLLAKHGYQFKIELV
jgi:restriction system protein